MELVKKSNFGVGEGVWGKGIRKFRFGGNCSQAARFGVVQIAQLPKCRGGLFCAGCTSGKIRTVVCAYCTKTRSYVWAFCRLLSRFRTWYYKAIKARDTTKSKPLRKRKEYEKEDCFLVEGTRR